MCRSSVPALVLVSALALAGGMAASCGDGAPRDWDSQADPGVPGASDDADARTSLPPDAGDSSGAGPADASTPTDASAPSTDGGTRADAGPAQTDAGVKSDAGLPQPDAGTKADAGLPKADAGTNSDAGLPPPAGPCTLYMDPDGLDTRDGTTPALAVKTLARVQALLAAARPACDVEVRIKQGVYLGQSVSWTYYSPTYKIRFMPADYQDGDGISDIAGRPVFNGEGGAYLLRLVASEGRATRLEFLYLQLERYLNYGFAFVGDRDDPATGWNGGNLVYGCFFKELGNKYVSSTGIGYGAIDLVNSRDNVIRNNIFRNIENAVSGAALHGVYLAHSSSYNAVSNNRFEYVSGDPIRVRDGSNYNEARDNVFVVTGTGGILSDWFCDKSKRTDCTKVSGECPSWENALRDSEAHCGYAGTVIPLFEYYQGATYVPDYCVDRAPLARIRTSGNTRSCP